VENTSLQYTPHFYFLISYPNNTNAMKEQTSEVGITLGSYKKILWRKKHEYGGRLKFKINIYMEKTHELLDL
jgi:hypothetical protein